MSNETADLDPTKAQSLQASLKKTQDTIRLCETKAENVGVGYSFVIDIIRRFIRAAPSAGALIQYEKAWRLISWILMFVPIIYVREGARFFAWRDGLVCDT